MRMKFQKISGEPVENVAEYVRSYIEEYARTSPYTGVQLFIGCDSLPKSYGGATYVTAICIYRVGRGAHILFARENKVKIYGKNKRERLRNRLWDEVYRSVEVANELIDGGVIELPSIVGFEIHLDVNPSKKWESNIVHDEVVGYVRSLGLDALVKPDSPAASFASDRVCRHKEQEFATPFEEHTKK